MRAEEESGEAGMKLPPRVVLDTNVVLSALLFGGGMAGAHSNGLAVREVSPLGSTVTAQELIRVLAYPKFKLSTPEQAELLADFMPWVEVVGIPLPPPKVPPCRDPLDLPFLHLAVAGKARALVSGDRDLLTLAGARGVCPILSVDAFCRQYLAD